MGDVFVCDAVRTPIGRFGGSLAKVRADDLAAVPIKALMARHPKLDWSAVDEVYFGCANQAGEDNRNVARMALLLAGLPESVPGLTLNRLCASGLDAVGAAGRAIRAGEIDFAIADGVDAMPETGENVAEEFQVSRADQDAFAIRSQRRAGAAIASGYFAEEITPVSVPGGKAGPITVDKDDADFVNPHGGAIALGHPLGMSGARLAMTAVHGMEKRGGKRALATMCVGVGQGVAMAIEKLN